MMLCRNATAGLLMAAAGLLAMADARAEGACQFTQGYWQNRAENAGDLSTEVWLWIRDRPFYASGLSYGLNGAGCAGGNGDGRTNV